MSNFFALLSRMKYIDRWALMRSARRENVSEHSLEVAMLTHALAELGNTYLGKKYDAACRKSVVRREVRRYCIL